MNLVEKVQRVWDRQLSRLRSTRDPSHRDNQEERHPLLYLASSTLPPRFCNRTPSPISELIDLCPSASASNEKRNPGGGYQEDSQDSSGSPGSDRFQVIGCCPGIDGQSRLEAKKKKLRFNLSSNKQGSSNRFRDKENRSDTCAGYSGNLDNFNRNQIRNSVACRTCGTGYFSQCLEDLKLGNYINNNRNQQRDLDRNIDNIWVNSGAIISSAIKTKQERVPVRRSKTICSRNKIQGNNIMSSTDRNSPKQSSHASNPSCTEEQNSNLCCSTGLDSNATDAQKVGRSYCESVTLPRRLRDRNSQRVTEFGVTSGHSPLMTRSMQETLEISDSYRGNDSPFRQLRDDNVSRGFSRRGFPSFSSTSQEDDSGNGSTAGELHIPSLRVSSDRSENCKSSFTSTSSPSSPATYRYPGLLQSYQQQERQMSYMQQPSHRQKTPVGRLVDLDDETISTDFDAKPVRRRCHSSVVTELERRIMRGCESDVEQRTKRFGNSSSSSSGSESPAFCSVRPWNEEGSPKMSNPARNHGMSSSMFCTGTSKFDFTRKWPKQCRAWMTSKPSCGSSNTDDWGVTGLGWINDDRNFSTRHHARRVLCKAEELRSKQQLCDVVLIAEDRRLPVHRVIISSASDYFSAMFTNDLLEAYQTEIRLEGIDFESLQLAVHYMYTATFTRFIFGAHLSCFSAPGERETMANVKSISINPQSEYGVQQQKIFRHVIMREDTVEGLLSVARLLQLVELVDECAGFLAANLHASNCLGIRQYADAQACLNLASVANGFIMEHFVEVIENQEFLILPVDDVICLLSSDDLNVPSEETIFRALVTWVRHDAPNRKRHLPRLLSHVKLPLLSPQFLTDQVESNSLLKEDHSCQELIMEAMKYHLLPERRLTLQSPRTRPRKSTVGFLYAVGGVDSAKGSPSIEVYNPRTNTWCQAANVGGRRLQFGVAAVDDRLYVVGGRDGLKTLNTVEMYDPKLKKWTSLPSMGTHRHGLGVGVLEGPLYAIGGHDGWSYLSTAERFDLETRQWTYITSMSAARSTVGVAVVLNKLYAVGGRDGSACLRSVECYDPHTNRWLMCSPMIKCRGGVGVGVCNGAIYAVGGHDAPTNNPSSSRYDSVERYDVKSDCWTMVSPLTSPRDAVGVSALGDRLYAVGGCDGQHYLSMVESYDPVSNEWNQMLPLSTGRAGACLVHMKTDGQKMFSLC